ncbi:MAG: hypothetical protein H8E54_07885, partial [Candidatus Aminicenantes bacterium]|nr:hypothetical protein [Candidatus Aminicenantes bacterium]
VDYPSITPTLHPKTENQALAEAIAQLEKTSLTREQRQVNSRCRDSPNLPSDIALPARRNTDKCTNPDRSVVQHTSFYTPSLPDKNYYLFGNISFYLNLTRIFEVGRHQVKILRYVRHIRPGGY